MPQLGTGILPSGAAGTELQAVTRRAFVPSVVVQIYKATPTLSAMLAAAEPISGGVSPVTQPVQGTGMVTTQATGYDGTFTAPAVLNGLKNAEFNLKAMVTPVPYYVMEGLAQMDAAVIPIVEARMNDAGNSIAEYLSTNLWTPSTSNLDPWAINDVIATANPARGNYGAIDRTTDTWWQGNQKNFAIAIDRNAVLQSVVSATLNSGGEMPTFGVMSPGGWAKLAQDFASAERFINTPESAFSDSTEGIRAMFTALSVAGVPIYMDLYAPDGTLVLFNTSYIQFKIHQDAAFAVTGPESMLPNMQLGYIMALVTLLEFVCSKPKAQTRVTGLTGSLTGL
jgi:hypothetical protein